MILDTLALDSGLSITLLNQTRHYFGGYFHVRVCAFCDIPLKRSCFDTDADFNEAVKILGESVRFERILEKMAVPESEVSSVLSHLTRTFKDTSGVYLSVADFSSRFVLSEYRKRAKKSFRTCDSRV